MTVVQNFIQNNLLSSCTGGFFLKHLLKWSVSSKRFADNVRFGSHAQIADMVQNFYLVAVDYARRDWLPREGIHGTQVEVYATMCTYTKTCT